MPDLDAKIAPQGTSGRVSGIGLKTRADFLRVAKGRRTHGRALSLQSLHRPEHAEAAPRFGLTVTRKVGGAVERNRIKRRFRAVLREPGLQPQAGHDYVIVARREALTLRFADLMADLARALEPARHRSGRGSGKAHRPASSSATGMPHGSST